MEAGRHGEAEGWHEVIQWTALELSVLYPFARNYLFRIIAK